jgi:DNA mismatch repair ATPase MutS
MLVDRTTLSDLEIFPAADGGRGVFQLIDRTATSRGRAALKRRLENPSADVQTIRRTQDAVRFLQLHPDILRLSNPQLEDVAAYLRSNITVSGGSRLGVRMEQAWLALRYRDLLRYLEQGARATVALFEQISRASSLLLEHDAPPLLGGLARYLAHAAALATRARHESPSLLGLDHALRRQYRDTLERALEHLAELDALNAMAATTSAFGWVIPELVDSDAFSIDAEDVFHPFVEGAVPNPVRLSGGEPMVFLTGPNMAGKTTYMRSIALVVLLGQMGMGVPARRARFTPVEVLFTSLNPTDDLRAGLSYFLVEVLRVKEAASILVEGRRALVLFDEVFKGTNVRDALDASAEVILGFARARRSGFVFSSHLAELVTVLESSPAIRFCYFDGDIVHDEPHFTYRLRDGVCDKRFGLVLLRRAGVPELLERISA